MKAYVRQRAPKTMEELDALITKAWNPVCTKERRAHFYETFIHRLRAIIESGGAQTKY